MFRKINRLLYRVVIRRTPVGDLLRGLPMFDSFNRNELHRLELCLHARSYARGETISARGTPGNALYIVRSGRVAFAGLADQECAAGDFFGEAALFTDARHGYTMLAVTDAEMLVLFRHDFEQFARRCPVAACRALFVFSRILAERSIEAGEGAPGAGGST